MRYCVFSILCCISFYVSLIFNRSNFRYDWEWKYRNLKSAVKYINVYINSRLEILLSQNEIDRSDCKSECISTWNEVSVFRSDDIFALTSSPHSKHDATDRSNVTLQRTPPAMPSGSVHASTSRGSARGVAHSCRKLFPFHAKGRHFPRFHPNCSVNFSPPSTAFLQPRYVFVKFYRLWENQYWS